MVERTIKVERMRMFEQGTTQSKGETDGETNGEQMGDKLGKSEKWGQMGDALLTRKPMALASTTIS